MYRITLHVPEQFNDGSPISEELLKSYRHAMGMIAYETMLETGEGSPGYQIAHELGGWLPDFGDWIEEPMRLIKINVAVLNKPYEKVKTLAAKAQKQLAQEAIYVTHEPSIGADLVREHVPVISNQRRFIDG